LQTHYLNAQAILLYHDVSLPQ